MPLYKTSIFSLKQKDFKTGKMFSPCKSEWIKCDCCGKLIVQGVIMSNGDKIGNDCYEIVWRVVSSVTCFGHAEDVFKTSNPKKVVKEYALRAA